ncbi:MAG: SAM-dependent methyltransferase [Candidatus Promineofilum sp.]|nr:SAM-dependent methyltransferase [Promineifilum sp.]
MTQQRDQESDWIPQGVDLDRPSVARVYDYVLGGHHNFEIDRLAGDRFAKLVPDLELTAQANRAFLRRAASFISQQGVDQFLDLGSGIPTAGNVHEIVRRYIPDARVVYVDIEPVAIAHANALLADDPGAAAILADVRDTDTILNHPVVRELIDFSRPVGLIAVAFIHYIVDDDEAVRMMQAFKDRLSPGSYLAISVWTFDDAPPDVLARYEQLALELPMPGAPRPYRTVLGFFDGFELLEPGLVHGPSWRPDDPDDSLFDNPERSVGWTGVARKP